MKWGFYGFPQNPQQIYGAKKSNATSLQIQLESQKLKDNEAQATSHLILEKSLSFQIFI